MPAEVPPWSYRVPLAQIPRSAEVLRLEADARARAGVAAALDLVEVKSLVAEVRLLPWFDGAEAAGEWRAAVVQTCGLSLEPFDVDLQGAFRVRAVPPGSPMLAEPDGDLEVDLDADDPPDVLPDGAVDVAAYVVEHLALELDPFPRKPGATFEGPPAEAPASPFAMLARLKPGADPDPEA